MRLGAACWVGLASVGVSCSSTRDFTDLPGAGGGAGETSGGASSQGAADNEGGGPEGSGAVSGTGNASGGSGNASSGSGNANSGGSDAGGGAANDPCLGVVCDDPPPSSCQGASQLEIFENTGTCNEGDCDYGSRLVACDCKAGACDADLCAGVVCERPDACHDGPGTCSPSTGKCTYPNKANDSPCSNIDGNACTADTCRAGVCTAGKAKVCPAATACHPQGTCNATNGSCSTPVAADHASCGTNLECLGGTCQCTVTSCPNGCCRGGACGACTPTTLATEDSSPTSLAIVAPILYFTRTLDTDPLVYSLPTGGGSPQVISTPPPAPPIFGSIAADASGIYSVQNSGSLPMSAAKLSLTGGFFNTISGSESYYPSLILTNNESVFVGSTLSNNYIYAFPKAGGTTIKLTTSLTTAIDHFAVDNSFLYFLSSNRTVLSRTPVGSSSPSTVVAAAADEELVDVAIVSSNQLVFASNTRVAKVAAAGGTAAPLDTGAAYTIISDGTTAYFFRARAGSATCASGSDLYGIPVAGGPLRRIASETTKACVTSLVQDSSSLDWIAGSLIRKAAK